MDCGVTIGLLSWAGDINAVYVRPTLTVTRKCFGIGKGIGRKPNNRLVSRVGWGVIVHSALMCRDVGWGQ